LERHQVVKPDGVLRPAALEHLSGDDRLTSLQQRERLERLIHRSGREAAA
jgi:hypothetical protein